MLCPANMLGSLFAIRCSALSKDAGHSERIVPPFCGREALGSFDPGVSLEESLFDASPESPRSLC